MKPVLPFRDKPEPHAEIANLRNLGPRSAALLAKIGIHRRDQLAATGAVAACRQLQAAGESVSLNLVYAIEGALMDSDWRCLPPPFREELRRAWRQKEKTAPGRERLGGR